MATFETETEAPAAPKPNFSKSNPNQAKPKRPNRYNAKCINCGERVAPEQGWLTGTPGNWGAEHKNCDDVAKPLAPERGQAKTETTFVVPEGRYTIEFEDGSYKTLRVRRQDDDANFKPGALLLSYLSGSDNDSDYTSFGHVEDNGGVRVWTKHRQNTTLMEAVKVLMGSPDAAREAYAVRSERCSRCGRTLTVPASVHNGVGPECAKKM